MNLPRHRGSTLRDYRDADGSQGSFQKLHRVYDREGKPCRNCRTPISRIVLGGRSTHFCPECQKKSVRMRQCTEREGLSCLHTMSVKFFMNIVTSEPTLSSE